MKNNAALRENIGHGAEALRPENKLAEATLSVDKSAALNVVGADMESGAESLSMGNVSEGSSDSKENNGDGGAGNSGAAPTVEERKASLLSKLPLDRGVLVKQIENEISKEIDLLHDKFVQITKSNVVDFAEASNVLRKIRELKGVLSSLIGASFDKLKDLWFIFVHRIM